MRDDRPEEIYIPSVPELAPRPIAVICELDPERRRTGRVWYFCSSHCRFQRGPYGDEVQYGSVTDEPAGTVCECCGRAVRERAPRVAAASEEEP